MSWVIRNIRATNRVARALRGGTVRLPTRAIAEATAELCANYRSLQLDTGFGADIVDAARAQTILIRSGNHTSDLIKELPCHFDHAIALLVEAGVEGEAAAEAVRSVQELFPSKRLSWIREPDVARLPKSRDEVFGPGIDVREFFRRLHVAQREVCQLHAVLGEAAASEERRTKLKRMTLAGIGLAVLGVAAGPLGWIHPVVAGGAGAVLGSEVFKAIMGTIGSTMFEHYTAPQP